MQDPAFGEAFVSRLTQSLQDALDTFNFQSVGLRLRFLADLMNATTVLPSGILTTLQVVMDAANEMGVCQVCTYARVCVCMCVCVRMCVCVCLYIYIDKYIYIYIHINT